MNNYVVMITDAVTTEQEKYYFEESLAANEFTLQYSFPGPAFVALLIEIATGKVCWASYGTVNNRQHIESVKERLDKHEQR